MKFMSSVGPMYISLGILIIAILFNLADKSQSKTSHEKIDAYLSENPELAKEWFEECQYRLEPKKCVIQKYKKETDSKK